MYFQTDDMKPQLTDSFQKVLDAVVQYPTWDTGAIALHLGREVDSTKRILNALQAMKLVDCLYGERLEQCWYPVLKLEVA